MNLTVLLLLLDDNNNEGCLRKQYRKKRGITSVAVNKKKINYIILFNIIYIEYCTTIHITPPRWTINLDNISLSFSCIKQRKQPCVSIFD